MIVARVKVEAMASDVQAEEGHYFEFHFKIPITSAEWIKLQNVCMPHGAHLFFNPYSQTGRMQPVVTLRRYVPSLDDAIVSLDRLLEVITKEGFPYPDGIEREYSILDTNVYLDDGWLFRTFCDNFITSPDDIPRL